MAYRKKDEAEEEIERTYFSPYADEEHTCPEWFPDLGNVSAGFFYRMMPVPDEPTPPEYVYVRSRSSGLEGTKPNCVTSSRSLSGTQRGMQASTVGNCMTVDVHVVVKGFRGS